MPAGREIPRFRKTISPTCRGSSSPRDGARRLRAAGEVAKFSARLTAVGTEDMWLPNKALEKISLCVSLRLEANLQPPIAVLDKTET